MPTSATSGAAGFRSAMANALNGHLRSLMNDGFRDLDLAPRAVFCCQCAPKCGRPAEKLNFIERAAWPIEYGLADLMIGDHLSQSGKTGGMDKLVECLVRLSMARIEAPSAVCVD